MKSLFKKNTPNDSSPKIPELPNAKEGGQDHSITSYFRDLARKKTASPASTKQTDDIMVKRNSNERKGDLNRANTFSGPKSSDLKQNQDVTVNSKLVDLGSKDFVSFGNDDYGNAGFGSRDFGGGDSINLPLKARKSTLKKTMSEHTDKSAQESSTASVLQRRSTKKDIIGSTDSISSISGGRRSSLVCTKDALKAKLEQQRQELTSNFGSSINSDVPISKVKLKESVLKADNKNRFNEDSDKSSSTLSIAGNATEKSEKNTQDIEGSEDELQDNDISKGESTRQEMARERWISAIHLVLRGIKSTTASSGKPKEMEIVGSIKRDIIDGPQNLTPISEIIRSTTISKTDNQKAKIISLLRKPAFYRGPEQTNALDQLLKTLPAFSRYSKSFRMKLIEKGFLLDLQPYRVVIRQGGVPMSLYFLLSGKCQSETIVVKNGKGYIHRSNLLPGDVFGEFGINSGEKRGCTVHTTIQSVVFSVPRDIYVQMMKEEVMTNKSEKIEIMRSILAFQTLSSTILETVLASCHVYNYEPNVPLLKVGERDNVIFVLEGQCRANRLVPFLVKHQTQVGSLTPEITGAYVPGAETGPEDSIVYYNMSIGLLGPGSFFPRISLLRHEGLQYRLQKFDLSKIIVLVNSILKHKPKDEARADKTNIAAIFNQELSETADDMEDMIAGVDLSVTTIDRMTCLVISKMDLVKILPEEVLKDMTSPDAEGLIGFSMSEIQKNYFDKIEWKGFREDVVSNVMEKKATIKRKN